MVKIWPKLTKLWSVKVLGCYAWSLDNAPGIVLILSSVLYYLLQLFFGTMVYIVLISIPESREAGCYGSIHIFDARQALNSTFSDNTDVKNYKWRVCMNIKLGYFIICSPHWEINAGIRCFLMKASPCFWSALFGQAFVCLSRCCWSVVELLSNYRRTFLGFS